MTAEPALWSHSPLRCRRCPSWLPPLKALPPHVCICVGLCKTQRECFKESCESVLVVVGDMCLPKRA